MRLKADDRIRKNIAHTAAKLIAVGGIEDYLLAKKKAAQQLNINNKRFFPSNNEIEIALIEYQSIFHNEKHSEVIFEYREIAYKAMLMLKGV